MERERENESEMCNFRIQIWRNVLPFMRSFIQVFSRILALNVNRYRLLAWYTQEDNRAKKITTTKTRTRCALYLTRCYRLTFPWMLLRTAKWLENESANISVQYQQFHYPTFPSFRLKEFHFDERANERTNEWAVQKKSGTSSNIATGTPCFKSLVS